MSVLGKPPSSKRMASRVFSRYSVMALKITPKYQRFCAMDTLIGMCDASHEASALPADHRHTKSTP